MRRAIELFAGAGGASLGILAAGYEEVRAVEWNHEACETRRAAGLRCDEGDVRDPVHYEGVGAIDLLWSSFPCQAWSTAGKRLGKDDPRNGWPWTVDVLDQVRPRWFLGENVAGLTHHRGACNGRCEDNCARLYLEGTILRQLGERFAWVGWRILDAARYGVPQNRERLILVAGPRPIEWPRETHAPPSELRTVGLFGETRKPWRTVREALNLGGVIIRESGVGAEREPRSVDEPAYTMRVQHNGGGCGVSVVGIATAHKSDVQVPWEEWIAVARSRGGSWCEYARLYGHDDEGFDAAGFVLRDAPTPLPKWACHNHRGGHAAPLIEDPKHPHVRPESPCPTIRSGGSGHSSPPMWLRTEMTGVSGTPDTRPSSTVNGKGNTYVHPTDPGVRTPKDSPIDSDKPAPTIRAQGAKDRSGHQGGCAAPLVEVSTRAASRPELLDRPSPTVTTCEVEGTRGEGQHGGPDRASDAAWLGAGIRRLTPAECAILQDFPADHPWRGTKTSIYAQIGNAVPPTLARVMCEAVAKADR